MKFRAWLAIAAGILPVTLAAIVLFLALSSWPAIHFNGWGFVVRDTWNLGNLYANPIMRHGFQVQPGATYGILFLIAGTLLSTFLALLFAVPVGIGAAIFLAEAVPSHLRTWISFFVEAIFIAIYVYGWDRLSPRAHFLSGLPIAISGVGGSLSVIAVTGWMNNPQGVDLSPSVE